MSKIEEEIIEKIKNLQGCILELDDRVRELEKTLKELKEK